MKQKAILLLIFIYLFMPRVLGENKVEKLNSEGRAAMNAGSFDTAIEKFSQALKADPNRMDIYSNIVKAYKANGSQQKDPHKAFDQFVGALEYGGDIEAKQSAEAAMKQFGKNPESDSDWVAICENYMSQYQYGKASVAYVIARRKSRDIQDARHREPGGYSLVPVSPKWPVACYFRGQNDAYVLRLLHQIQEHWIPVKEFAKAELVVGFGLNADGSYTNLKVHSYSNAGTTTRNAPKEVSEVALKAVKTAAPFDRMPSSLLPCAPMQIRYTLGEKYPVYGVRQPFVFQ